MRRLKFILKLFFKEPLWFKILIITTLLISIILVVHYFQSISKLAAAILFCACGYKWRRNFRNALILFTLAGICIFLAISQYIS